MSLGNNYPSEHRPFLTGKSREKLSRYWGVSMFTSVMHSLMLQMRGAQASVRQRFNLSFWCTLYSVVLLVIVAVSFVLSVIASACMSGFARLRERLLYDRQRVMNLAHVRNYFSQRR